MLWKITYELIRYNLELRKYEKTTINYRSISVFNPDSQQIVWLQYNSKTLIPTYTTK